MTSYDKDTGEIVTYIRQVRSSPPPSALAIGSAAPLASYPPSLKSLPPPSLAVTVPASQAAPLVSSVFHVVAAGPLSANAEVSSGLSEVNKAERFTSPFVAGVPVTHDVDVCLPFT